MKRFEETIRQAIKEGSSDLHIIPGHRAAYRKHGLISFHGQQPWGAREIDALVRKLLSPQHFQTLQERFSVDFAISIFRARLRVNVFSNNRGLSLAIRILPGNPPTIDDLNLHPCLHEISSLESGLVLFCGATGVGKTSTIAAVIDEINANRLGHIITLENPIEYRFQSKKCVIQQRELGMDMPSFDRGLIDILREDPDVIVVGELRDPETMRLTLNVAESGHLVIGTLHASSVEEAMYRLLNSFPPDSQDAIRIQLASVISWLIVQDLVPLKGINFRVPLLSILRGTTPVKNVIRDNKLHQIEGFLQTGRGSGMFSADRYMEEFLLTRQKFASPIDVFRPSEESDQEPMYHSVLLRKDAYTDSQTDMDASDVADRLRVMLRPSVTPHMGHDVEGIENLLNIKEEASIEELIKEFEKR
ncbi:MAG: twitching motility protein PilT [Deltaproteobacteria bacterium HGW-Deltaproteobacteria-19]|jgi:pilus retraction protein PilT|nr:MAG: twitching motility protein PilT [Deltaproteobacteria bacterium HGW-Deltaproteobacteria-19]